MPAALDHWRRASGSRAASIRAFNTGTLGSSSPATTSGGTAVLSERFVDALNEQIAREFAAAHQYVGIGAHYAAQTFPQLSVFFYEQTEEEREHAMKMVPTCSTATRMSTSARSRSRVRTPGPCRADRARARAREAGHGPDQRPVRDRARDARLPERAVPAVVPRGAGRGGGRYERSARGRRADAVDPDAARGLPRARDARQAGRLASRRAPQFSRALSAAPAVPTGRIRAHATATGWRWRRATTQSTNAASRSTAARRLSMPAASKTSALSSACAVADDLVEDMPWVGLSGYVFTRDRGTLVLRERSHSPSAFACASRRSVEVAPVPSSPRMRKLTAPRLGSS
jgi:hypothetical protein